jgi:OOP family OmpA-OmpF porin
MLTNKAPWIILLVLWMIGSTWWHVCEIKQLCLDTGQTTRVEEPPTEEKVVYTTPPGADGFTIADDTFFRISFPRNFSFAKSGSNANMNALGGPIDPLITYLKANRGRTLTITGYYTSAETNSTTFPNLGMARAEGMKQYLVQQGIQAASLTTKGTERNLPATAKGDSLVGGLDFAFGGTEPVAEESVETELTVSKPAETSPASTSTTATSTAALLTLTESVTEKELAEAQKFTSIYKSMDLYFQLGEATFIKTDETKKFFDEAAKVLNANPGKKLLLTGYTDDKGPEEMNLQLSRDRANDVKARIRKSGVKSEQIEVRAKGELEPKADNSTLSGRKANRRVTVVVPE